MQYGAPWGFIFKTEPYQVIDLSGKIFDSYPGPCLTSLDINHFLIGKWRDETGFRSTDMKDGRRETAVLCGNVNTYLREAMMYIKHVSAQGDPTFS